MCLIDTIDGALMLALYVQPAAHFMEAQAASQNNSQSSTAPIVPEAPISRNPRDPIAFLYYSIVLTSLTVVVAIVIGVLQLLTMISAVASPEGRFWDGVETAGEYYEVIGGSICACFLVFGGISVFLYPYWRRRVEKSRPQAVGQGVANNEEFQPYTDLVGQEVGVGSSTTVIAGDGSSSKVVEDTKAV